MYVCLMTEEVPDMKTADLVEVYPNGIDKLTSLEMPRRVSVWFPLLIELPVWSVGKKYKTKLPSKLWKT